MHFLLIYDVASDYITRRAEFRDEHLKLAWSNADAGDLLLGGALEEPTEQAYLLFTSREAATQFVASDPYVRNGLVRAWRIKQWNTVVGSGASMPKRPL